MVKLDDLVDGELVAYKGYTKAYVDPLAFEWIYGYVVKDFPPEWPKPQFPGWDRNVWAYWEPIQGGNFANWHIGWVSTTKVYKVGTNECPYPSNYLNAAKAAQQGEANMNIMTHEVVERPTFTNHSGGRGRKLSDLSAAVLETINGGAVRIGRTELTEKQLRGRRTQYSALARRHGFALRSRTDDTFLYLWVEALPTAPTVTDTVEGEGDAATA